MAIIEETAKIYEGLRARGDKCCVFFSGGKDSLVVLDFATRYFEPENIHTCFMELVPDLDVLQGPLDEAEIRFGVKVTKYPHWGTARIIRNGVYCNKDKSFPDWKVEDIYALAMKNAGTDYVLSGARAADSPARRRYIGRHKGKREHLILPIVGWGIYDVKGYLKMRGIPLPQTSKSVSTGVDLSTKSLMWLYDYHRADFEKMAEYFPYIEAVVWRERWYGETV